MEEKYDGQCRIVFEVIKKLLAEEKKLKKRIAYFKKRMRELEKKNTVSVFTRILEGLIQDLKIPCSIVSCKDGEILRRDVSAFKKFREVLEELNTAVAQVGLETEKVSSRYFHDLLLKFMEEGFVLSGRESVHGVKVLNFFI